MMNRHAVLLCSPYIHTLPLVAQRPSCMKAPSYSFALCVQKVLIEISFYRYYFFLRENTRHQEGGLGLMGVSPLSLYILEDAGFLR